MKKLGFILLSTFLLSTHQIHAQIEDTDMEELVIDKLSRANIIEIIKKVRNQMYHNYTSSNYDYKVSHRANLNKEALLIDSEMKYQVNINLKNKKIIKSVVKDPGNRMVLDTVFFNRYSGNDSPMYWLTEIVIRKYVNVPELDFFNNFKDYGFERMRAKDGTFVISFYSDQFYEGYFQYDSNFNLKKMEFELLKAYPIDHSQSKNGKFMFEKNWVYRKEKVAITFKTTAEGKNYVDELKAYEEIDDYNFVRYNSIGEVLIQDVNLDFDSNLVFKKM